MASNTAIKLINSASGTKAASTEQTITITAPKKGNLLVLQLNTTGSSELTAPYPDGFELLHHEADGDNGYLLIKRAATGDETSLVVNMTVSEEMQYLYSEFSGVDKYNPVHTSNSGESGAVTTVYNGPAITTTIPGCLIYRGWHLNVSSGVSDIDFTTYGDADDLELTEMSTETTGNHGYMNNHYGHAPNQGRFRWTATVDGGGTRHNAFIVAFKPCHYATPDLVQGKVNDSDGVPTSSAHVTLDSAPTVGNLLVMTLVVNENEDDGLVTTMPKGWEIIKTLKAYTTAHMQQYKAYKVVQPGEPLKVEVSFNSSYNWLIAVEEFSGIDPVNPWDEGTESSAGSGSSITDWGRNIAQDTARPHALIHHSTIDGNLSYPTTATAKSGTFLVSPTRNIYSQNGSGGSMIQRTATWWGVGTVPGGYGIQVTTSTAKWGTRIIVAFNAAPLVANRTLPMIEIVSMGDDAGRSGAGGGPVHEAPHNPILDLSHPINRGIKGAFPLNSPTGTAQRELVTGARLTRNSPDNNNIIASKQPRGYCMYGGTHSSGHLYAPNDDYWNRSYSQDITCAIWVNLFGRDESAWERVLYVEGAWNQTVVGNVWAGGQWMVGNESGDDARATVTDNEWQLIVVRGRSNGDWRMTLNDIQEDDSYTQGAGWNTLSGNNVFFFQNGNVGRKFHGLIQNCRYWFRQLSDDEVIDLYHKPWVGYYDSDLPIMIDTAQTLHVQSVTHEHYSEKTTLTAGGGSTPLTVKNTYHDHEVERVTLTQHNALAVKSTYHNHISEKASLTQHNSLGVKSTFHTHVAAKVTLTQVNSIVVKNTYHEHVVERVTLTQSSALTVKSVYHDHEVERVTLTQNNALSVKSTFHSHLSENIALTQHNALTVKSTYHDVASQLVNFGAVSITIYGTVHTLVSEKVALTQNHALGVRSTYHNHVSEKVSLTQHNALDVRDSYHGVVSDKVTLAQEGSLLVKSTVHSHVVAKVALTQSNVLSVKSTYHNHTVERLTLVALNNITVKSPYHGVYSDNVTLAQHNTLVVKSTYHANVETPAAIGNQLEVYGSVCGVYSQIISTSIDIEIEIGSTGYCGIECVQRMNPLRTYNHESQPKRGQVLGMINNYFDQINGMLSALGYQTPVASTNGTSIAILRKLNCLGAASLAEEAAHSAGNVEASQHATELYDRFKMHWDDLANGWKSLPDATRTDQAITRKDEKHPDGEFRIDSNLEESDPTFNMDTKF